MTQLINKQEQIGFLAKQIALDTVKLADTRLSDKARQELVHNIRIRRERIRELQKLVVAN